LRRNFIGYRLRAGPDPGKSVSTLSGTKFCPSHEALAGGSLPPLTISVSVLVQSGRFTRSTWLINSDVVVMDSWIRRACRLKSGSKVQSTIPG
jgi:hypothetical protein